MTLTELKYIVAVARERHFGRAADACFVAQPTLSVAIKKLEDELAVKIFERGSSEISLTALGAEIVQQAQTVLEQADAIRTIAQRGQDPLAGALRLGVIYTIAPYLLPELVQRNMRLTPQMPLVLQENFTHRLLDMLRSGELDCAIMAEPFPDTGLASAALYDEPFWAAIPRQHRLARQRHIVTDDLRREHMLLLGSGHCLRDHVLEVCPEFARFTPPDARMHPDDSALREGIRRSFEGSSLETIKYMVAAGMGITLVPALSVPHHILRAHAQAASGADTSHHHPPAARTQDGKEHSSTTMHDADWVNTTGIHYLPFADDIPTRRVVLVWRRSFTRYEAIAALRNAICACTLPGVQRLAATRAK